MIQKIRDKIDDIKYRLDLDLDQLYRDRNLAVLWALKEYDGEVGWRADSPKDDWVVIWAKLPEGQVGWHVKREIVEKHDWIEQKPLPYDGHSTQEKHGRMEKYL